MRRGVKPLARAVGLSWILDELVEMRRQLEELRQWTARTDAELWNPPYTAEGAGLIVESSPGVTVMGFSSGQVSSSSYLGFEDVFRGTEEFIRERQRAYLAVLPAGGLVIDLGCGRGEMLELLSAEGRAAVGVDLDSGMVERCRARGFDVVQSDALAYLQTVQPDSVSAVFSAQFVEHISTEALLSLLTAALRTLEPGGVFIAETVNPHSVSALRTFWVDLTHQRPIFPETLLVMCREAGYEAGYVLFPLGSGDFEQDRRSCGEYAVVVHKR